ncbi:MAG: pyridoxamine 5'-phosphate oxidase family protein [Lachnospiraceae bacterium]|nr:pyridoxamine 5'-phosphate oxidase family protein [Lachnospiraceae bacterium]
MGFRKMRRFKQEMPKEVCERILREREAGVLAVLGDDGYPYTVPLNYAYVDGKILFHGAKDGHKVDALRACDKASFCVIDADDVVAERMLTHFRSVIAFGRVRIIDSGDEMKDIARKIGLRFYPNEEAVEKEIAREVRSLACFEMTIEHLSGKEDMDLIRQRNNG